MADVVVPVWCISTGYDGMGADGDVCDGNSARNLCECKFAVVEHVSSAGDWNCSHLYCCFSWVLHAKDTVSKTDVHIFTRADACRERYTGAARGVVRAEGG